MNVSSTANRLSLRIGHSPDPDDAFMWYPLANFPDGSGPGGATFTPTIDTGPYDFVHVLEDIQSLNDRCEQGELEITALSIHQYPYVADRYVLTREGLTRWLRHHEVDDALALLARRCPGVPPSVVDTLTVWAEAATRVVLTRGVLR